MYAIETGIGFIVIVDFFNYFIGVGIRIMEKLAICFLCLFSLQVNLVYFLFFLFTASGPLHCEINNEVAGRNPKMAGLPLLVL